MCCSHAGWLSLGRVFKTEGGLATVSSARMGVLGFVTMLAVAQVILVPLVALETDPDNCDDPMENSADSFVDFIVWSAAAALETRKAGISYREVRGAGRKPYKDKGYVKKGLGVCIWNAGGSDNSAAGIYSGSAMGTATMTMHGLFPRRYPRSSTIRCILMIRFRGSEMYWDQGRGEKGSDFSLGNVYCNVQPDQRDLSGSAVAYLSAVFFDFIMLCGVSADRARFTAGRLGKDIFVFDLFVCRSFVGLYVDTHARVDAAASHLAGKGSLRKLSHTAVFLPDVPTDAQGVPQGLAGAFVCCGDGRVSFVWNRDYDGARDPVVVWNC